MTPPMRTGSKCRDDGTYAAWWGVDDLHDLNEDDQEFRDFICGKDGVVRKWLRAGARGWRLDVADELSDDFIVQIKDAVLAEKPDSLLIGEGVGGRVQQDELWQVAPVLRGQGARTA